MFSYTIYKEEPEKVSKAGKRNQPRGENILFLAKLVTYKKRTNIPPKNTKNNTYLNQKV